MVKSVDQELMTFKEALDVEGVFAIDEGVPSSEKLYNDRTTLESGELSNPPETQVGDEVRAAQDIVHSALAGEDKAASSFCHQDRETPLLTPASSTMRETSGAQGWDGMLFRVLPRPMR